MTFRPMLWPSVLAALGLAILCSLGVWQLQRAEWKGNLLHRVGQAVEAAPVPLAQALRTPDPAYAHVRLEGRFLHGQERYVFTSRDRVPGVLVFTPFVPEGAAEGTPPILVNRGFVPEPLRDPEARKEGQVPAPVTVTGILRPGGAGGGLFTPDPQAAVRTAYAVDLEVLAALGATPVRTDWFVEADESPVPGGWPRGRDPATIVASIPNNHLSYAATWFGLALVLAGVYVAWHMREGRLGRAA